MCVGVHACVRACMRVYVSVKMMQLDFFEVHDYVCLCNISVTLVVFSSPALREWMGRCSLSLWHSNDHSKIRTHTQTHTHTIAMIMYKTLAHTTHTHKHTHIHTHTRAQMYTRTRVHAHTYTKHTHKYTHTYTHTHTHAQTYTHIHAHTHTQNTNTNIHPNTQTHIHTHTYTHITRTYTHTNTHTYTHIHTITHTHLHTGSLDQNSHPLQTLESSLAQAISCTPPPVSSQSSHQLAGGVEGYAVSSKQQQQQQLALRTRMAQAKQHTQHTQHVQQQQQLESPLQKQQQQQQQQQLPMRYSILNAQTVSLPPQLDHSSSGSLSSLGAQHAQLTQHTQSYDQLQHLLLTQQQQQQQQQGLHHPSPHGAGELAYKTTSHGLITNPTSTLQQQPPPLSQLRHHHQQQPHANNAVLTTDPIHGHQAPMQARPKVNAPLGTSAPLPRLFSQTHGSVGGGGAAAAAAASSSPSLPRAPSFSQPKTEAQLSPAAFQHHAVTPHQHVGSVTNSTLQLQFYQQQQQQPECAPPTTMWGGALQAATGRITNM